MFTVLIESDDGRQQVFKEFPSVCIFKKGSAEFDRVMESEDAYIDGENFDSYKAVIRSDCGEHEWFVADSDFVYITNQHGKTVATIK